MKVEMHVTSFEHRDFKTAFIVQFNDGFTSSKDWDLKNWWRWQISVVPSKFCYYELLFQVFLGPDVSFLKY